MGMWPCVTARTGTACLVLQTFLPPLPLAGALHYHRKCTLSGHLFLSVF